MQFSIDFVFLGVNLILLAFSYGSFSEQIKQLKESLAEIKSSLINLDGNYYPNKDGIKLEQSIKTMWDKFDSCDTCRNSK